MVATPNSEGGIATRTRGARARAASSKKVSPKQPVKVTKPKAQGKVVSKSKNKTKPTAKKAGKVNATAKTAGKAKPRAKSGKQILTAQEEKSGHEILAVTDEEDEEFEDYTEWIEVKNPQWFAIDYPWRAGQPLFKAKNGKSYFRKVELGSDGRPDPAKWVPSKERVELLSWAPGQDAGWYARFDGVLYERVPSPYVG